MSPGVLTAILVSLGLAVAGQRPAGSRAEETPWFRYRVDRVWMDGGDVLADLTAELRGDLAPGGGAVRWKLKGKVIEVGASEAAYRRWQKTPYVVFNGCGGGVSPL